MLEWLWCQAFSTSIPAYAGLYLRDLGSYYEIVQYPRIRGVVSRMTVDLMRANRVSPHTRGCICGIIWVGGDLYSIPAYAGLYRTTTPFSTRTPEYPRIRGVVSRERKRKQQLERVSPHTRGCIHDAGAGRRGEGSIPAYAGLYRL